MLFSQGVVVYAFIWGKECMLFLISAKIFISPFLFYSVPLAKGWQLWELAHLQYLLLLCCHGHYPGDHSTFVGLLAFSLLLPGWSSNCWANSVPVAAWHSPLKLLSFSFDHGVKCKCFSLHSRLFLIRLFIMCFQAAQLAPYLAAWVLYVSFPRRPGLFVSSLA